MEKPSQQDYVGHWSEASIRRVMDAWIMNGRGNEFAPNEPITRAEIAVVVDRLLKQLHYMPCLFSRVILFGIMSTNPEEPVKRSSAGVMLGGSFFCKSNIYGKSPGIIPRLFSYGYTRRGGMVRRQ
ncbi:S-layer homology domain-containing protein [Paenibacillus thiaminolyticus]|uniref:S-layer homology domain-containing protein n=1 Tax=Paenibacillus thiaminolyticus TaxID=49283 RepID=UPI002542E032|nr:S-layer homology domain-containing protein [Paenibacillus thiaminolyticus]WII38904.1 S-layer homology domain-containing protein [Paenibacillus thiaminolyticus]